MTRREKEIAAGVPSVREMEVGPMADWEEGPVAAEEWLVTVGLLLGVAFPPRRVSIWHRWEWAWQRPLE